MYTRPLRHRPLRPSKRRCSPGEYSVRRDALKLEPCVFSHCAKSRRRSNPRPSFPYYIESHLQIVSSQNLPFPSRDGKNGFLETR